MAGEEVKAMGYVLAWLLGVPVTLLVIVYLFMHARRRRAGFAQGRPPAARFPHHRDQRLPALGGRGHLTRERDPHARQPLALPQPELEPEPIDRDHRRLVSVSRAKCARTRSARRMVAFMCSMSRARIGERVRLREAVIVRRHPVHRAKPPTK